MSEIHKVEPLTEKEKSLLTAYANQTMDTTRAEAFIEMLENAPDKQIAKLREKIKTIKELQASPFSTLKHIG